MSHRRTIIARFRACTKLKHTASALNIKVPAQFNADLKMKRVIIQIGKLCEKRSSLLSKQITFMPNYNCYFV